MTLRLLSEHHLELLSLTEAAQAHLSLHLSKCHIVGNHMSRLNYESCAIVHILHISCYGNSNILSCQPGVTVTSCFVYKVIRDLESIDHLCINPICRIGLIHK